MFLRTKDKHFLVRNGDRILYEVGTELLYTLRRKFSILFFRSVKLCRQNLRAINILA